MGGKATATACVALSYLFFLLATAGCAVYPRRVAVPESEATAALAAFAEMRDINAGCGCCLDASAAVSIKSLWRSGTVEGYLQAMQPSYLKFVGVNPLGQPFLLFATDGDLFRLVSVPDAKGYEGTVQARAFRKYAPRGFDPKAGFAWLTGRLPGDLDKVLEVEREDGAENVYWITVGLRNSPLTHQVLFDAVDEVIRRHIVLDEGGAMLLDVRYEGYVPAPEGNGAQHIRCRFPAKITVTSGDHNGTLSVAFSDWLPAPRFGPADFVLRIPASFERVLVK